MERRKSVLNHGSSSNGSSIKGLQLFIADLRSSQQSEEHEKRIQSEIFKIKQHFESASKKVANGSDKLGGYQRKKYVAKLAYIYVTSNTTKLKDILFGLDQMVELLQSNIFSEKFMAYMILELLYEHPAVISKVRENATYHIIKDLSCNNDNFVGLALNFIGVVGKLDNELAMNDEVVSEVFQILRSPTSSQYLKKKSALSFLTLLRSNPNILIDNPQRKQLWIQRILSLLDDTQNYRLMLPVLPLVEYIAKYIDPSYCIRLLPQLTQILHNCVIMGTSSQSEQFPSEFKFANVPNPWLITKIVSLLSILIVSPTETNSGSSQLLQTSNIDRETLGKLRMCVTKAIELGTKPCNDPMERIVHNTVLFSLINFASKLDPSQEAISNSVTALCSLLSSAEINIRYLTLDSLVKLCSLSGKPAIDTVRYKNLNLIFHLLNNERDSSIVRKVVDLLYTFTDADNVQVIVDELFNYILSPRHPTDPTIKSDVAVKIAILTEKYATDRNWFVLVSLKLLSRTSTGSLNDDEIWQRLCQIVVNNPQLHKIICEQLVDYLYDNHSSEAIVKTGAFLLGEYADLVTDKISMGDLFNLFTDKYFTVSNITKAMILTTIVKLYKFCPSIESVVIKFFQLELNSLDIELQTRSYEYLNLVQVSKFNGNMELLSVLFSPMPPFNTKSNPLLKRLGSLPSSGGNTTLLDSLGSLHIENESKATTPTTSAQNAKPAPPRSRQNLLTHLAEPTVNGSSYDLQQRLSANWEEGFGRMLSHRKGILYTSPLLRILYRITALGPEQLSQLKVTFTFINQAEWEIAGFSTEIIAAKTENNPEYILQNVGAPSSTQIKPHKRVEQSFDIIIRKSFSVEDSPFVRIYFSCGGSSNSLALKAAIGVTTSLATDHKSSPISLPQFVSRWKKLRDALGEDGEYTIENIDMKRKMVQSKPDDNEIGSMSQTINRMGFEIVEQSSIPNTLFISGIIHTKSDGNFGCLIKLKYDEQKRHLSITCKATSPGSLAKHIVECVKYALAL